MSSNDNKSKLATALGNKNALVAQGGASKGAGLSGALARRDGTAPALATQGPQGASIDAVRRAVSISTASANTAYNDAARAREHLSGICFVIDATGSRQHSWQQAQRTQAEMFDAVKSAGNLKLSIVCHRGNRVSDLGTFATPADAKRSMAAVSCEAGNTEIIGSLKAAMGKKPSTIIMIGDCFEENFGDLQQVCSKLAAEQIRVYAFVEGNDPNGQHAYKMAADLTGGIFQPFGSGLDLSDLCVAAAVFDVGGQQAFDKLIASGHAGAKALEHQVKRLGGPGPKLLK